MVLNCKQGYIFFLILYQKSSCTYPFVNIWSCREKSKATKRIVKSDLMCFAKQRKSSNCIVDIVQMNFFAAIDTHPWSNKDHSNSVLSSRLYSPVCLPGNPYQNCSRWGENLDYPGKLVRIWTGTKTSSRHRPFQIAYQKNSSRLKNSILNKNSNVPFHANSSLENHQKIKTVTICLKVLGEEEKR